jgi:hypothetical protein
MWIILILGPKREEVMGGWRKLYNGQLHNFYTSTNIITVINQAGSNLRALARMGQMRNECKIFA